MTVQIRIENGTYRSQHVNGVFDLVKEWKAGAKGGFVTVVNDGSFDGAGDVARVKVAKGDFEVMGELSGEYHAPKGERKQTMADLNETDEQTIQRIEKTFSFIEHLTTASQKGQITGLIISGPAGVGKSYGVERTLEKMNFLLPEELKKFDIITGGTSPIGLYIKLWDNRQKGKVLVFDDCDTALFDELQLNMLKAAMDTKKKRRICWMKESNALKGNGDDEGSDIPNHFEYEGSIIFLTNLKFDQCKSKKIAAHLEAIMSRVHYLDLCLDTRREQLLRVKQVVAAGMLDDRNLTKQVKDAVVQYVYDNVDYLHELSLRTVLKVADLAAIDAKTWADTADFTVLSHTGRIQKAMKAAKAKA
jgi:hypothetical protein